MSMDYRTARCAVRQFLGGETMGVVLQGHGLTHEQFEQGAYAYYTREPAAYDRATANGARRLLRREGRCPECGHDAQDGNCSPMYDAEGLCADCGEARYAQKCGAQGPVLGKALLTLGAALAGYGQRMRDEGEW